jgi:glutamate/tyrosine decarboxylase-like PLP-dependent enzyme
VTSTTRSGQLGAMTTEPRPAQSDSDHPSTPATRLALRLAAERATAYLETIDDRPVRATATRDELLASFGGPLPEDGAAAEDVVDHLVRAAEPGLVAIPGPRYFGFVIGGAVPSSLAADWLTSTWDQNAGVYAAGPAASVVEEVVGGWLVDLFGLPTGTGFGFTTGCQMAHFTCLAAARHRVLERVGWNVEEDGLIAAPRIDVLVSEEVHATVPTALQYLGMGRSRTTVMATDAQGRIRLDSLAERLPTGSGPLIVVLQAGNVNTGAFDPLGPAIALVRERRPDAWIHVDGAFGMWAAASPALSHLAAGIELADSWATDGHKALNVPYDSGIAFVRDAESHVHALSPKSASYIIYGDAERDEFRWVPEYSRRARGFAAWAAMRELGRAGIAGLIERQVALAGRFAAALRVAGSAETGDGAGIEVLNDVVFNQVLVRFLSASGDPAASDARTRAVVAAVQDDGTCWLSGTTWHGLAAMRISVSNWSTTEADVDRSVDAIVRIARATR